MVVFSFSLVACCCLVVGGGCLAKERDGPEVVAVAAVGGLRALPVELGFVPAAVLTLEAEVCSSEAGKSCTTEYLSGLIASPSYFFPLTSTFSSS